jgi:outer membrane protein OmpA-like peptidoglycan-associated protein
MMGRFLSFIGGGAVLLVASAAGAQVVEDPQDYPVERLRLAMDGDGVLDAEAGSVPVHGTWNLGLWIGVANDPLVAYQTGDGESGPREAALVGNRVGANLAFAYSIKGWVELGLDVPLILYQDRDDMLASGGMLSTLSAAGLGDLRLSPKVKLLAGTVDVAVIPALTFPTGGGEGYFGDQGVTFAPEVAVSTGEALRVAGNLGYRTRKNTYDRDLIVEDEITLRAGVGYRAGKADFGGGFSAALPASAPIQNGNANALELLVGAGYLAGPLHLYGGAGVGVEAGYGVPDWRVFIGTRYTRARSTEPKAPPVVVDNDHDDDGILDADDDCRDQPEDKDEFEDADGCPELDNDKDTFADAEDRCPNDPEAVNGFEDDDGCPDAMPDTDGDGLTDDLDACKDQPEDVDGFKDEDGCPEDDNDEDGVLDISDACPEVAGPIDNHGCPDSDRDADTVVDRLDNCPDEPGTVANQGCKAKQLVVIQGDNLQILDKIMFKEDRAVIQKKSHRLLRNLAAVINAHPQINKIEIAGYTSSDGDDDHNLSLSQRRADEVMKFLVGAGVDPARLVAVGYGEADPIADNARRKGRNKNRRVEFRILASQATETPAESK